MGTKINILVMGIALIDSEYTVSILGGANVWSLLLFPETWIEIAGKAGGNNFNSVGSTVDIDINKAHLLYYSY